MQRNHPALQAAYTQGVRDAEREFRSIEQQREEQRAVNALEQERAEKEALESATKQIKVLKFSVPQGPVACEAESKQTAQCLKDGKGLECSSLVAQLEECARQAVASQTHR